MNIEYVRQKLEEAIDILLKHVDHCPSHEYIQVGERRFKVYIDYGDYCNYEKRAKQETDVMPKDMSILF